MLNVKRSPNPVGCPSQGNVVAQGGYTELQKSGLDFTSLLKDEDEEEQQATSELARSRTVSSISMVNDEADQMLVGIWRF